MSAQHQAEPTYALYAQAYLDAGWPCVLPVPSTEKHPPPAGFTGADGRDTDQTVVTLWARDHPYASIALRMPDGVIGIDVDHYPKGQTQKVGGETLAALETALGPLPPTWISSARPAPSGIRFYRVPPGRYATKLVATQPGDGAVTGDIEVIQRHHRYAVVAPSAHEVGTYAWWWGESERRQLVETYPSQPLSPGQLPELPAAWVEHLRSGASAAGPAAAPREDADQLWPAMLAAGQPCVAMLDALTKAETVMGGSTAGTRHDLTTERVMHVVMLAAHGHPGLAAALDRMTALWHDLTSGEEREAEFERMWTTATRKAVTAIGGVVPRRHVVLTGFGGPDCRSDAAQLEAMFGLHTPAEGLERQSANGPQNGYTGYGEQNGQADSRGQNVPTPLADYLTAYISTYGPPAGTLTELVGVLPFDPAAGPTNEQGLAAAVLERAYPALRYAADACVWYARRTDGTWDTERTGHRGMVGYLTELAPAGDSGADKGSPAQLQSARRARLRTSAGEGAVASKMVSLISNPDHPSRIHIGKLDLEPELKWAGGVPWDLSKCRDALVPAAVDWRTPHRHDAGVLPQLTPTPVWNAFLAAVFPDPELRAWALRVLSIGFTGYADAAMPVLLGQSGRGKTSVAALLTRLAGSYGAPLHPAVLFGGTGGDKYLNQLHGLRLAFVDESPFESAGATERLKQITGGAPLNADVKYERPITFEATHTVVITSNHEISLSDPALVRRYRPIWCDGDPEEVRRTRVALEAVWHAERPGILAGMMLRAAAWLADRESAELSAMPAVAAAVMEQAADDDLYGAWISECTVPDEYGMRSGDLFSSFVAWALAGRRATERTMPSVQKWGRVLTDRGYPSRDQRDDNGSQKYRPLVLRGMRLVSPAPGTGIVAEFMAEFAADTATASDRPASATTETPGNGDMGETATKTATPQNPSSSPTTASDVADVAVISKKEGREKEGGANRDDIGQGEEEYIAGKESPATSARSATTQGFEPGELAVTEPAPVPGVAATCPPISGPIAFDLETHSANSLYTTGPSFVRLGVVHDVSGAPVAGLNDDGSARPVLTTDWRGLVEQIHGAADDSAEAPDQPWSITGHNLFGFDYQALARYHGLDLARVVDATFDTILAARHLDPPMARERGVDAARKYDLDTVAERLGLAGKAETRLPEISKRHPACELPGHPNHRKAFPCAGAIPLDDPDYQHYTRQDAAGQADVARALSPAMTDSYLRREHRVAAIAAQMSLNGLSVDTTLLSERLEQGATRKAAGLEQLAGRYAIPITDAKGKPVTSPLATNDGKAALERALLSLGVPAAAIPRTPATNLIATGGDGMRTLAQAYPQAGELCELVAGVTGERTIYQTVAKHLVEDPDGITRVHPKISFDQATGRWSLTRPGMTVFGKRGERWREREVILPEPGHVFVTVDLSQVDMRGIAALSGDRAYAAMFAPGRDAHTEIANLLGLEREPAKAMGHGWNYGLGVKAMIRDGIPAHLAYQFDAGMTQRFPRLIAARQEWREWAASGSLLDNGWGRPMRPDPRRAYTQGPALMGQGAARDIGMEGLLRCPVELWPYLRLFVHDEIGFSVPKEFARDVEAMITKAMTFEWRGVPIVAQGQTWEIDGQKVPAHGRSWGHVYSKVG